MKKKFLAVGLLLSVTSMHASGTGWFSRSFTYAQERGNACVDFLKETIDPNVCKAAATVAGLQVARKVGSYWSFCGWGSCIVTYAVGLGFIIAERDAVNEFVCEIDKDTKLELFPSVKTFDDNVVSPVVSTTILNRVPLLISTALVCSQSTNSWVSIGGTALFTAAASSAMAYNTKYAKQVKGVDSAESVKQGHENFTVIDRVKTKKSFLTKYCEDVKENCRLWHEKIERNVTQLM